MRGAGPSRWMSPRGLAPNTTRGSSGACIPIAQFNDDFDMARLTAPLRWLCAPRLQFQVDTRAGTTSQKERQGIRTPTFTLVKFVTYTGSGAFRQQANVKPVLAAISSHPVCQNHYTAFARLGAASTRHQTRLPSHSVSNTNESHFLHGQEHGAPRAPPPGNHPLGGTQGAAQASKAP